MDKEIKMEEELEKDFLADKEMILEEIDKLNEELCRAIRETDIELGEIL